MKKNEEISRPIKLKYREAAIAELVTGQKQCKPYYSKQDFQINSKSLSTKSAIAIIGNTTSTNLFQIFCKDSAKKSKAACTTPDFNSHYY